MKFVPRPLTPGPELRQVESVLRARLKCPWTVRILVTTYHFLRLRAVGELWPIFAEDDAGIAFERVKAHRVHPTIGLGVESVPRQTGRGILLVKAQVESAPRALNPGSPSRRVEYVPRVWHWGRRVVAMQNIKIVRRLRAGGNAGNISPRMPRTL